MEFGVYKGKSLEFWSNNLKDEGVRIFAFDTFTGLPKSYRKLPAGTFSTDGDVPDIQDYRIKYVKGLFQKTVPKFFREYSLKRTNVIHIDSDLYSSASCVLHHLIPVISKKKTTILIFDEFSGSFGQHEFRAFVEISKIYNMEFTPLAADFNFQSVAFEANVKD